MFLLLSTRRTLLHFTRRNPSLVHKPCVYFSTSNGKHDSIANPSVVSEYFTPKNQTSASTNVENPKIPNSVISFLKGSGFSETQMAKFTKARPQLCSAAVSLDKSIKPKFKFLQDFGFSDSEIAEIFSKDPWILDRSLPNTIAPALSVLNGLLGSKSEVARLLMISGRFLKTDLEKTLMPNIEYLLSCGMEMDRILNNLHNNSRFFLNKPDMIKQFVDRAVQLGADRSSGMFIHSIIALGQMSEENWERKLQALRELGFSEDDISEIFRGQPQVFRASVEKVKSIKEVLLDTGKYTMQSITSHPEALNYSVERRYKPRLSVLAVLERKDLIKKWPSLSTLYTRSDKKFFDKYVAPHLNEISEVLPEAAINQMKVFRKL